MMILRRVWALAVVAACGGDAPPARARVLAQIPANATTIFAADGRALSHTRFRPIVDVLRTEIPAGLDCVVDAALAGDAVAAGVGARGEVTVALATRAHVSCAALSKIDGDLWIATLGAGGPTDASVMTEAEHARARPFLRDAPVALVTAHRGMRVLGTAAPDPLAMWVAFDAADPKAATQFAYELGTAIHSVDGVEALAPLSKAIVVDRNGSQVVARLGATNVDLAIAMRALVQRAREVAAARAFPCPAPIAAPVLGCKQQECTTPMTCAVEHNRLEVYSLASALDDLLAARKEPVIVNGRVEGVRLRDDLAVLGLLRGDMLVAIDGRRVTAVEQVVPYLQTAKTRTHLIVERLHRFGTIELVEN
jgi:hypothetical protein